jgi:glycosyltransferase involved in cell wall biosynthesis
MVSIVLVTYNRAARLRLSIQDILNQTFKDFELIICDDCSTDSTEDVCREFEKRDRRIKYFRHLKNMQMPANCNFGIQKANSDYVAILHDGDRFKPDLIEQWHQAISNNESVGFVFNSIGEIDEHNQVFTSYQDFDEGVVERDQLLKRTYFRQWRFSSPVYGQAMVRKSLLTQRGFLHADFGFYADVDLWMDLLHDHDAYYCADTLIVCPTKKIQPRLFEDNRISYFLLMFNMQFKHRKKAFRHNALRLSYEMIILWVQSFFSLSYWLLCVIKNQSFRSYFRVSRLLRNNPMFFTQWTIGLIFYPVLYPLLKVFTLAKGWLAQVRPVFKKKRGPAYSRDWLSRWSAK